MILKKLKIKEQLLLGLALLLLMVLSIGAIAIFHGKNIHEQMQTMYDHPFKVRYATARLTTDIVSIQRDMRDLCITTNELEMNQNLMQILHTLEDAKGHISIIESQYLGPHSDLDSLQANFNRWNEMRTEIVNLVLEGNAPAASVRIRNFGEVGIQAGALLNQINTIDAFATHKINELSRNSDELVNLLNSHLYWLIAGIIIITILIFHFLMINIRRPLEEIRQVTVAFQDGNLDARCKVIYHNEFGKLAAAFNELADTLQANIELNRNTEALERLMLSEDDKSKFFSTILGKLREITGSQIAAVYLLNENKKQYTHFYSIGAGPKAKATFSADPAEGEFGAALSTGKIQHIKDIPQDTRFTFHSVAGDFVPSEIITIPVNTGSEIIAVISLSTVGKFDQQILKFLDEILISLTVRIEGVLSYQQVKDISARLEVQNKELEIQKTELVSQSGMLSEQNIELEMQKKQLSEASRLKTNFLSNMSHELRTPLNSVIALTGVLGRRLSGKIPQEEFSYLEVIERNGRHLLSLINDILDIARIEAGRVELEVSRFNLAEQIAATVHLIEPQAKQKNIDLLFKPGNPGLQIESDPDKISHILQNLVGNAVKFTEKGTVQITTSVTDKEVSISVTDTGIGIAEEHLSHIFDEFRQADGSTTRRFGGTGLGLALVKKYTRLLGGKISVSSIPGQGSVFTLQLPLEFTADLSSSQDQSPANFTVLFNPPLTGTDQIVVPYNKSILLVEDSEPAIIQIQDLLLENGVNVLVARNGEEALAIIEKVIPDAMILDLMIPGVDGFQVLKTVRSWEKTAALPVLILTARFVSKDELSFLKENNIYQLMRKGDINLDELLNRVVGMVSGKNVIKTTLYGDQ